MSIGYYKKYYLILGNSLYSLKNNDNKKEQFDHKKATLNDISQYYLVLTNNKLQKDKVDILVNHYKNENSLLELSQFKNLLEIINGDIDNEKLLCLIKEKLEYDKYKQNYNSFFEDIDYFEKDDIYGFNYKINNVKYYNTSYCKNKNNYDKIDAQLLDQILVDLNRIGNILSLYLFNDINEKKDSNKFLILKREEMKFKNAMAKVLFNIVYDNKIKYYQGMNDFVSFFLLLSAKKDSNFNITYNEKEAYILFNLFLDMKFDKIILKDVIKTKEFQIKDFFDMSIMKNLFKNLKDLHSIINKNLSCRVEINKEGLECVYLENILLGDKNDKSLSILPSLIYNFNITKTKTFNDIKKIFLLLFITHNYNVLFDIYSISTLKFYYSDSICNEEYIDLSI